MDKSSSNFNMYDDKSRNDSLQKYMESISMKNPSLSDIAIVLITSNSGLYSIEDIRNSIKYIKIVYPDKDEIPLIKIKDENSLESGENIERYIFDLSGFDDSKFDKCGLCKYFPNYYFCRNCNKNICDEFYQKCLQNNHILNTLKELSDKISYYISNIRIIFDKNFIQPKNKKENDEIIKKNKNFDFLDEYEMNSEIEEKPMDYTYDILLIEAIIEKNYKNYFHYKNIEECFNYVIKKYPINNINEKLNIKNDINTGQNEIDIDENSSENNNDYIVIRYKINETNVKIFGNEFVEKNMNICKIVYEKKEYKLTTYFNLKNIKISKFLEIKLIGVNNAKDVSNMFYNCSSLISLPDKSKWNTNNATNMGYMFYNCSSLKSLPNIWNTSNVTNMSYMFYNCSSLKSLPDISKWNTNNVNNMSYMFYNCSSLISLPDISKWNINNAADMSFMFYNCS